MTAFTPVTVPDLPIEGGCQCGRLRYRIVSAPVTCYACHCSTCRKESGSAFGLSLQVPADGLEHQGPTGLHRRVGGSGRTASCIFCRSCGNRVTQQLDDSPVIVVKPGTLDDCTWLRPAGHIFAASNLPWIDIPDDGSLIFDGYPDLDALKRHWRDMSGQIAAQA